MTKKPGVTTIATGYYSRSALNTNFEALNDAFDNTLSLDGSTPNSMQGDLDLNGNEIINGIGKFNTLYLGNDLVGNLSTAFTFLGAWVTGTSYSAYDVVTDSGNTYVALETHTAGSTFSTDLAAGKWSILAAKGASGSGSGDMLVANNLSDVANVATSRSNLGLGASDSPTFTNITPTGTVDGRDLAVDGAKLDLLNQGLATTDSPTFNVVTATSYAGDGSALTGVGGLQFISSVDLASDAYAVFTGFDGSKYDSYKFVYSNVIPASDSVAFDMQFSSDGGSSYDTGASDYKYLRAAVIEDVSTVLKSYTVAEMIRTNMFAMGSAANEDGSSGEVSIYGAHLAKRTLVSSKQTGVSNLGYIMGTDTFALRNSAVATNAIRFFASSGNMASGTITMYGMVNS